MIPFEPAAYRRLGLALSLCCAAAVPATAQNISSRGTGLVALTGLVNTYNFNSLNLVSGDVFDTQLQSSGLRFSGAFFGTPPNYAPFPDGALYNVFDSGNQQISSDNIDIFFSTAAHGVAFNFASILDGPATFTLWSNGMFLRSFQVDIPAFDTSNWQRWWGFQFTNGTTFDRLQINGSIYGFGIDNLMVETPIPVVTSPVPEPATVGLLCVGLAIVGATVRRRRAAQH